MCPFATTPYTHHPSSAHLVSKKCFATSLVLSDNSHGVESILLGKLLLNLLHDGLQVLEILCAWVSRGRDEACSFRGVPYCLASGPLLLGEKLVLVTALDSASEAVDTLVGLAGGEALEGLLGDVVFLLEEIVVSIFKNTRSATPSPQ